MTTTLYVFTGTGNSLAAAEFLAQKLGDTVIESIPIRMKKAGVVIPDTNKVGFVFPVNYCGVPFILSEFIPRVSLSHVPYIFAVATAGGIGRYALLQLDKMLKKMGLHFRQDGWSGWLIIIFRMGELRMKRLKKIFFQMQRACLPTSQTPFRQKRRRCQDFLY